MRVLAKGTWWRIVAAKQDQAEVLIYGNIGESWWGEESVTARDLVDSLSQLRAAGATRVVARINSNGGAVSDGVAIYNALRRLSESGVEVVTAIDGAAISSASLIAMAGDRVEMAANALLMIHAPWTVASGNAEALRSTADVLDTYAEAMLTSYARKTGKPVDELRPLLTDGQDHWYTAEQAVAEGFADTITQSLAVAASLNRFTPPAALAAIHHEAITMVENKKPAETPAAAATPEPSTAQVVDIKAARDEGARAALERDKARRSEIRARVPAIYASRPEIREILDAALDDPSCSADQAAARVLAALGQGAEPLNRPTIAAGPDARDKWIEGAAKALLVRAGKGKDADLIGNEFRGQRLMGLASDALARAGISVRGMVPMEIARMALSPQTTSDFPVLLENVLHKSLLGAYAAAEPTWRRFCTVGTLSDFRPHKRYRLGTIGDLQAKNEAGEFVNGVIPDGEAESIAATTRGLIVGVTRQTLVNDDLGAMTGVAAMVGQAAARTIEKSVYSLLTSASGAGPTLSDGVALFNAAHGNMPTSGAVLSVASLDAARAAMAQQKDPSGNDFLDIMPAVLLVPIGYLGAAQVIIGAEYDPDTANKLQRPNMVRGLVSDIVGTPRLSGTAWYLFANPSVYPTLEVGFLDGQQDPVLERMDSTEYDGTRWVTRLDWGVAALDFRGAYRNPGASS